MRFGSMENDGNEPQSSIIWALQPQAQVGSEGEYNEGKTKAYPTATDSTIELIKNTDNCWKNSWIR